MLKCLILIESWKCQKKDGNWWTPVFQDTD